MRGQTSFARLVADALRTQPFTLIDIGCSSGIDDSWRVFANKLRAFGFDPNIEDIQRLSKRERLKGVSYVAAFVGVPAGSQDAARMHSGQFSDRTPWDRLSVNRTLQIRASHTAALGSEEKTKLNLWSQVPLADPKNPVILSEFLRERDITDVDFIKIDVDGADFLILRSLERLLSDANVFGLGIEVNFHGSDDPNAHSFHNVDRFMKRNGFELFSLSARPYSMAALPAPYQLTIPAQAAWGRILQGDALYVRDAAAPHQADWAKAAPAEKLLKLAAVFSLAGLPDCAADVLVSFREKLANEIDVEKALDLLTKQSVPPDEPSPSYAQYMAEFEADAPRFWPANRHSDGDATVENLRAELTSLKTSKSWRLTAPLRATASMIRKRIRTGRGG